MVHVNVARIRYKPAYVFYDYDNHLFEFHTGNLDTRFWLNSLFLTFKMEILTDARKKISKQII